MGSKTHPRDTEKASVRNDAEQPRSVMNIACALSADGIHSLDQILYIYSGALMRVFLCTLYYTINRYVREGEGVSKQALPSAKSAAWLSMLFQKPRICATLGQYIKLYTKKARQLWGQQRLPGRHALIGQLCYISPLSTRQLCGSVFRFI